MQIRYSVTLNTGEVIADSISMVEPTNILNDIWEHAKRKVYALTIDKTRVVKTANIMYLVRNVGADRITDVSGPFTMCV